MCSLQFGDSHTYILARECVCVCFCNVIILLFKLFLFDTGVTARLMLVAVVSRVCRHSKGHNVGKGGSVGLR